MSWALVPCLVSLRHEFDVLAPTRDRASDGSIGDVAHRNRSSDHNPDETGVTPFEDGDDRDEVHAIDVDKDLTGSPRNMAGCVAIIVDRHRQGLDDRLQNVIYNRRIASRSWGWTWRDYTGSNPHDKHAHFSARYTTAAEADVSPWGLLEEEEMTEAQAKAAAREAMEEFFWDGYHAAQQTSTYQEATATRQKEMRNARDTVVGIIRYALPAEPPAA